MANMVLTDIAALALEMVGVKPVGQDAGADEWTRGQTAAAAVYEDLVGRDLAIFDQDEVPEWAQVPFAALVAVALVPVFNPPPDRVANLMPSAVAESKLAAQVGANTPSLRIPLEPF